MFGPRDVSEKPGKNPNVSPKLVVLDTPAKQAVQSVVEVLEAQLAEARGGTIAAVAVSFVRTDGFVGCLHSDTDSLAPALLGAVSYTHHRIVTQMNEGVE